MGRTWNRVKSAVYTRLTWLNDAYVRAAAARGSWADSIPLPPLAPLQRPLSEVRLALLTSAGIHLREQRPFDMHNPEGDATIRVIPGDTAVGALRITHDYYDHAAADRDVNCVFPVERIRELVAHGVLGAVAPRHVSFMGHILGSERDTLVQRTVGEVAELFRADDVDAVLASPG